MKNGEVAQLVRQTLAGEKESFSELVRRYQDYAYGVAIGVLSDFELARDVVQESFLCAYRDLKKLKDPARFGGWLRGIVRHTALRALREQRHLIKIAEEMREEQERHKDASSLEEELDREEREKLVRDALAGLKEEQREAVSLYYVNGFSYQEISGFLGVDKTTVQGRLQHAREKMRKEIDMVEKTFKEKQLPDGFADEIKRLLESASRRSDQRTKAIGELAGLGLPAVEPLCNALKDSRHLVKQAAGRALCEIGDARALRPMLRVFYADDCPLYLEFTRGRAFAIPGVREELMRFVREGKKEGDQRSGAIEAMSYLKGDKEVAELLLGIFRNTKEEANIRRGACVSICRVEPKLAAEIYREALQCPDFTSGDHWRICYSALRDGIKLPIDVCLTGFGRNADPVSRVIMGRLVLNHGGEGKKALKDLLAKGSEDEKATAALALASDKDEKAFEVLTSELVNGYQHIKWQKHVAQTMMRHYAEKLPAWYETLDAAEKKHPSLAWLLAQVRLGQGKTTPHDLLHHASPYVRAITIENEARKKGAEFLPELRRCLRDGKPGKPAQAAFRQMLKLRDEALPLAQEMLESKHWTERKAAACLLRRWGKLTPEQAAKAAKDEHVAVRHAGRERP